MYNLANYYHLTRLKWRNFPFNIGINLTSNCNSLCSMCTYTPEYANINFVNVYQIWQLNWLHLIPNITLFAGVGDPLTHPAFEHISMLIKSYAPKSTLSIFTNGIALNPQKVSHVDNINISLNAASSRTWSILTNRSYTSFDHIITTIPRLRKRPTLSFVACRSNIHELYDFILLAADLGVKTVNVCHYLPTSWSGSRAMPITESLYYEKGTYDYTIKRAYNAAKSLGVALSAPRMFSQPFIPMSICLEPWNSLYLTVSEDGDRRVICCCSGVYFHTTWESDHLSKQDVATAYNSLELRHLRKTVNSPITGGNALCRWCKSTDRFDPSTISSYEHIKSLVRENKWYD